GSGEVPVGDVDRDALLAFAPQAVGEQRQVGVLVAAAGADGLHGVPLVFEERLRVVQQPPDEGGLAVVDAAGGGEAQQLGGLRGGLGGEGRRLRHQKYPSRFRSSIAASEVLSSPRVAPRSVMRVAAISAMIWSTVVASERTPAVSVASPTVR